MDDELLTLEEERARLDRAIAGTGMETCHRARVVQILALTLIAYMLGVIVTRLGVSWISAAVLLFSGYALRAFVRVWTAEERQGWGDIQLALERHLGRLENTYLEAAEATIDEWSEVTRIERALNWEEGFREGAGEPRLDELSPEEFESVLNEIAESVIPGSKGARIVDQMRGALRFGRWKPDPEPRHEEREGEGEELKFEGRPSLDDEEEPPPAAA